MTLEKKRQSRQCRSGHIAKNRPHSSKCKTCCRKFTAFLFSHVGLCALVVGYSVMGAFTFRALEAPHEEKKVSQVIVMRQETVKKLWDITIELNVLFKENWTHLVAQEVKDFQSKLLAAIKDGYDGKEGTSQQWSFSGAFLYSLTVITTIGYGNIAPKTDWGKLVTILYAIVGIPLMFLYLTNVGNILAKTFKYVYGRLCSRSSNNAQQRLQVEHYQVHHIVLQDPTATIHNCMDPSLRNKLNASHEFESKVDPIRENRDEEEYTKTRVAVPITLCLAIITGYICGGAALFSMWEGWDYLDGSYFCFVTLSTIGFGDLVPGDSVVSDSGSQEKLVICSLYLLAGMALIAMCFNLVQEEVVHKTRNLCRRIGIINESSYSP